MTLRGVPPIDDPPTLVATGRASYGVAPVLDDHPTFADEDEATTVGPPPDESDFSPPGGATGDEMLRRIGVEIEAIIDRHPTVVRVSPDVQFPEAPVHVPTRPEPSALVPQAIQGGPTDAWEGDPTPAAVMVPMVHAAPPVEPFVLTDTGTDPGARSMMTRLPAAPMPPPAEADAAVQRRQRAMPTEKIGAPSEQQIDAVLRSGTNPNLRRPARPWVPLAIIGIVLLLGGILFGVYHSQQTEADAVEAAMRAVNDAQESAREAKRTAKRARDAERAARAQQQAQTAAPAPFGTQPAAVGTLPAPFGTQPAAVGTLPVPLGTQPAPIGAVPGVAPVLTSGVPGAAPIPPTPGLPSGVAPPTPIAPPVAAPPIAAPPAPVSAPPVPPPSAVVAPPAPEPAAVEPALQPRRPRPAARRPQPRPRHQRETHQAPSRPTKTRPTKTRPPAGGGDGFHRFQ